MLKGISGATGVMDDVLTAAPMKKEHGGIWCKVAERATSYHLKPTFKKYHIHQSALPYVGHLITADQAKPKALGNMTLPTPHPRHHCSGFMIIHCTGQLIKLVQVCWNPKQTSQETTCNHWDNRAAIWKGSLELELEGNQNLWIITQNRLKWMNW